MTPDFSGFDAPEHERFYTLADPEGEEPIEYMLEHDELDTDAQKGVARQLLAEGVDSLSPKQKATLNHVLKSRPRYVCRRGGELIDLDYEFWSTEYCSYCHEQVQKDD